MADNTLDVNRLGEVFEAIEEGQSKLNSWETDFVSDMQERWNKGQRSFSENQINKLEQIYLKV